MGEDVEREEKKVRGRKRKLDSNKRRKGKTSRMPNTQGKPVMKGASGQGERERVGRERGREREGKHKEEGITNKGIHTKDNNLGTEGRRRETERTERGEEEGEERGEARSRKLPKLETRPKYGKVKGGERERE